jgi:hypothetical protein
MSPARILEGLKNHYFGFWYIDMHAGGCTEIGQAVAELLKFWGSVGQHHNVIGIHDFM